MFHLEVNNVFFVNCLRDRLDKGSYSGDLKLDKTAKGSQGGALSGTPGLSILKDLIRSLRTMLEDISGKENLKTELRTELYPEIAEEDSFFFFLSYKRKSATLAIEGLEMEWPLILHHVL